MECLGGNGYVDESPLARAYREAPVNAIWEGSGNVMALDLLRAAEREEEAMDRLLGALAKAAGDLPGARAALDRIKANLRIPAREAHARRTAETLALLAAAAALKETAPAEIAEAFAQHRLAGIAGRSYGDPISGTLAETLIARSFARAA
jgi:putative acyl-CoA dehydrogenase